MLIYNAVATLVALEDILEHPAIGLLKGDDLISIASLVKNKLYTNCF